MIKATKPSQKRITYRGNVYTYDRKFTTRSAAESAAKRDRRLVHAVVVDLGGLLKLDTHSSRSTRDENARIMRASPPSPKPL